MAPMKLSLFGSGSEEEETVQLDDDDLVGQLRKTVDAHPDLTLEEALRQGIQHVVENGPKKKSG
jgi:hypothetical protein